MSKSVFHKLLALLCVLLCFVVIVCACNDDTPEETPGNNQQETPNPDPTPTPDPEPEPEPDPTYTYTVTVKDADGNAMVGVNVQFCNGSACVPTVTDANGVATLTTKTEVNYEVTATATGYVTAVQTFATGVKEMSITMVADVEPEPEPEPVDPTLGTIPTNPIFVEFEWNEAGTAATATVTVGAGKTVYFAQYRIGGMLLTINEEQPVLLADNGTMMPTVFVITNEGEEDAEYELSVAYPLGTWMNPEVIDDISFIFGSYKESFEYYYAHTIPFDGTLEIDLSQSELEMVTFDIEVYNLTTGKVLLYSVDATENEWGVKELLTEVSEGDELLIHVIVVIDGELPRPEPEEPGMEPVEPEVYYSAYLTHTGIPGTIHNPHYIMGEAGEFEVNGGETVYYQGNIGGQILTIVGKYASVEYNGTVYTPDENGVIVIQIEKGMFGRPAPVILGVSNSDDDAKTFTYALTWPVGAWSNPDTITFGEQTAATSGDGYFYTWTAPFDGTLTIWMSGDNWTYSILNETTWQQYDTQASIWEDSSSSMTVTVAKGDVLQIVIGTADYMAADVTFEAIYDIKPGCDGAPFEIGTMTGNYLYLEGGDTVYYKGKFGGMTLNVSGAYFAILYNGVEYYPVLGTATIRFPETADEIVFAVVNYSDEYNCPVASLSYPVKNLITLDLVPGNTVIPTAGNGFRYLWTADANGMLTFSIDAAAIDWAYVNVNGYGVQGEIVDGVYTVTTRISEGDNVEILIGTATKGEGTVGFDADFTTQGTTAEDPIWVWGANVSVVNAGTLHYAAYFNGMIVTVTGEGDFSVIWNGQTFTAENGAVTFYVKPEGMMGGMSTAFAIVGDGTYTISTVFPVGHSENADTTLDEGTTTVESETTNYHFKWTAPYDGDFTVTIAGDNWFYTIDNLTTYQYGEWQYSSWGCEPTMTVTVAEGDVIQLVVGMGDGTSGEVSFEMDFAEAPGTEANPIWFMGDQNMLQIPAGKTVYYTGRLGGRIFSMVVTDDIVVTYNGIVMAAEEGIVSFEIENLGFFAPPTIIAITNNGDDTAALNAAFTWPVGHSENPAELTNGSHTAYPKADGMGYHFAFTAEYDGKVNLIMSGDNWAYEASVMNPETLVSTSYGYQTSAWDDSAPSMVVSFKTGDVVKVMVSNIDYSDATVTFKAYFGRSITVAEAVELTKDYAHNTYSTEYYYVTGLLKTVTSAANGHFNIFDLEATDKSMTTYYSWDWSGNNRYSAMTEKPDAYDVITIYGKIGVYSGTTQIKDAKIYEWTAGERPVVPGSREPDFDKLGVNSNYSVADFDDGWTANNAAVLAANANGKITNDTKCAILNGKKTAKGSLTSNVIAGGVSKITFEWGLPYGDTKFELVVNVKVGDEVVATTTLNKTGVAQGSMGTFEWTLDEAVTEDCTVEILNTGLSNSSSNKDRVAIWGVKVEA